MKVILLYIVMVGLPVIGVAGVLQLGQRLMPPVSVGGTWEVQITSQSSHSSACPSRQAGIDRLLLHTSQSGRRLAVVFNNGDRVLPAELEGEINGKTIAAEAIEPVPLQPSGAFATHLQAKIDRDGGADRLLGVLTLACCQTETEMAFVASRRQKAHKEPGAH